MKRIIILAVLLGLLFTGCNQQTKEWWLELKYQNETQLTDYRLNMPINILEDNTLSGLGILEVRQLIEGDTTGFPECLAGETNGVRVRGEIAVIGSFRDGKILVESLEPTGGPGSFSLVYFCAKNDVERDVKIYNLTSETTSGQLFMDTVVQALFVFSEGMLKFPMNPTDKFSGQDDQGFSFILHRGTLPETKKVPTPYIKSE